MIDPIRDGIPDGARRGTPVPPRRLQNLMRRESPLTVFRAPLGFGANYLARWWAASGRSGVTPVYIEPGPGWVGGRLWQELARALASAGLIGPEPSVCESSAADDVRRLLMHIRGPVRIVVFRLDHVGGDGVDDEILHLIDVCPMVEIAVTVTGRRLFRRRGALDPMYDLVDGEVLRHTRDDMLDIVDAAGIDLRPGELEALHAATGGQPGLTCVALDVAANLPALPRRQSILEERIRWAVHRSVERSVSTVPAAATHGSFLMHAAPARFLTREIARFLDPGSDPEPVLEALEDGGILAYCDTEHGDTWILPPAVRHVLLEHQRVAGADPRERLTTLAHYHLNRNEYGTALRYAIEAQQWILIASIVEDHVDALIGTDLAPMGEALRALPEDVLASRPRASAARELVELLQGDRSRVVRGTAHPVPEMPRTLAELDLATHAAMVLRISGAYEAAAAMVTRIRCMAPTLAPSMQDPAGLHPFGRMQWALTFQLAGDLPAALAELGVAHRLGESYEFDYVARNAAGNAALAWALTGDSARVREWLALEAGHAAKDEWAEALTRVGGLVARALTALDAGEVERAGSALAWLDDLPPVVELWPFLVHARCRYAIASGRPEHGLTVLTDFADSRRRARGRFVQSLVEASELEVRLALGDGVRAMTLARTVDCLHPWDTAAAARAHLLAGDPAGAIRVVRRYDWFAGPYVRFHVDALLVEAVALQRIRQDTAAHRAWARAFDLAARIGYSSLLGGIPRSCAAALAAHTGIGIHSGPDLPQRYPDEVFFPDLTDREAAVLRGLAGGLSAGGIADALQLTVHTVKSHCRTLYRKLGVRTRKEAVETARRLGVLDDSVERPALPEPSAHAPRVGADPGSGPSALGSRGGQ